MLINEKKLTIDDYEKLKEDELLLITYPGRMGDIKGCSFVIKKNNNIIFYRIDDLYEFKGNIYEKFPKWNEALKNYSENKESKKYEIIYMGMGNLLAVDKSVFREFETLIKERTSEIKENYEDKLKFGIACYSFWKETVYQMYNHE